MPSVDEAMPALDAALDAIPKGTPLRPAGGIPYTAQDKREMQRFLENFAGQGVVCSVMDKADNTLVWQCPHDYCCRLVKDLYSNGVYQVSSEGISTATARHAAFISDQGLPTDTSSQSIPYYFGCPKMHKDPVDMRFISSSASSSMKPISVWINRALIKGINHIKPEQDL